MQVEVETERAGLVGSPVLFILFVPLALPGGRDSDQNRKERRNE